MLTVAAVVFFISLIFLPVSRVNLSWWGIDLGFCIGSMALMAITMILYFIDKAIGAVISIDDSKVVIRQLFGKRKIVLEDIEALEFDDYSRRVVRSKEYRVKLAIVYGGGRKIKLTDNASRIDGLLGFITGERKELPYHEIPLYQASKYISDIIGS